MYFKIRYTKYMKKLILSGAIFALLFGAVSVSGVYAKEKDGARVASSSAIQLCKDAYNTKVTAYYDALKAGRQAYANAQKAALDARKAAYNADQSKDARKAAQATYKASLETARANWKTARMTANTNLETARTVRKACIMAARPTPTATPTN